MVRYLKKGFASTIQLLWEPPSGERSVIPLRLVKPLLREEFIRLRGRLPLPRTR